MPRPKAKAAAAAPAAITDGTPGQETQIEEFIQAPKSTPQEVLKANYFWEGWAKYHDALPLGPDSVLQLPPKDPPDPENVGFAMPLACIEYALRNERKFPPPSDNDMFREMFKLVNYTLKTRLLRRSYTMSIIYNHINRNYRDSPGWQRGFIKAGGPKLFYEIWKDPEPAQGKKVLGDQYWIVAIFGRMLGTSEESRAYLIPGDESRGVPGVLDTIIAGTRSEDANVADCAICALKALIQFPEGRAAVPYQKLIECLQRKK